MLAIIINKTNVPADLRSAGIEYKDFLIRSNYRCFTKVRKEKLAGYFFNLSQLTFTGTGVGGIAPILQGEFGVKNYVVIIFGIVMTFIFAGIANRILKY